MEYLLQDFKNLGHHLFLDNDYTSVDLVKKLRRGEAAATSATSDSRASFTVLPNYKRTGNSSNTCFVHNCSNTERLTIPSFLRFRLLKSYKLYVTENARICYEHVYM